jgi:hypothetical protein
MASSYKLPNDPNKTTSLHITICIKKDMVLDYVLEIMQYMVALLMELMMYSKHQHFIITKPQFGFCSQIQK